MQNNTLAKDYLVRATKRLAAVKALVGEEAWADAVRESQEIVELALKGLLRACKIDPPRVHDVSAVLEEIEDRLPDVIRKKLSVLTEASRSLRRDRELAFYGSEDLTPSEFYKKNDALDAQKKAQDVVAIVGLHGDLK